MPKYRDVFIRDTLTEINNLPRPTVGTASPDIIPWGTQPAEDPATEFGADTYAQKIGKTVAYGQANYIYVRGKNYSDSLAVGSVSLYAAYQAQLSLPSSWTRLSTDSGANTSAIAANAGDVAVATDAFVWTPALPAQGNPYVLIAVIATQADPDPVPAYKKNPQDFATWQVGLGGVSASIMSVPVPPQPKASYTFSALVNVGNASPVNANFSLSWKNGVVGDLISLSADTPGTAGPIGLSGFQITAINQNTGTSGQIPANYSSVVEYSYQAQDTTHPPAPTLILTITTTPLDDGGGGSDPFNPPTTPVTPTQIAVYQFTSTLGSN